MQKAVVIDPTPVKPPRNESHPYIASLKTNLESSIRAKNALLVDNVQLQNFARAVECVVKAYRTSGRLYIAGNGGSAADAQHLAAEFVSKLARPRSPLPAEALTVDSSILTAIGNDFGYEHIFARQIAGKMTSKDVFLGITTSGESKNILLALEECRKMKIRSIVFSGRNGGSVKNLADFCVIAPGTETSTIQEVHMVLYHTLCGAVENELFPV